MDERAEKLVKARKKLRDHQEKRSTMSHKGEVTDQLSDTPMVQESLNDNMKKNIGNVNEDHSSSVNGETEHSYHNKNLSDFSAKSDINIAEILISNRTNLETQISDLNGKLAHIEYLYGLEVENHNICKQKLTSLQSDVTDISNKYFIALEEINDKKESSKQITTLNQSLKDENNNLSEQLEFTKSMLTSKEFENAQLQNQIFTYQNQLDLLQLQIQQLTNNSPVNIRQENKTSEDNGLLQNILNLEQKIEALQKERDQIQSHYEHYVYELNEQLKSEMFKSENLAKDLDNLYNRESSLIDQISDMEIRLQNYDIKSKTEMSNVNVESSIEKDYQEIKDQLEETNSKYNQLQIQYAEVVTKIQILQQEKDNITCNANVCNHDNVDITKLSADISSDKLAAQRATEQNKKLKLNIEELEQIIVKMGKDKLDLTEKLTHEKQLNKGLALKLAEVEENLKNSQNKLKAKDDEMIRLQNEYRVKEKEYEKCLDDAKEIKSYLDPTSTDDCELLHEENHNHCDHKPECKEEMSPLTFQQVPTESRTKSIDDICIQKEDAMIKLQERFLNIMDEVANLSDEKHRLEHIILQLQNETDTICEYVALYQQQRSLLKKREEERSNQLKIFQTERDKLERHLDELSELLLRLATDEQIAPYFKQESRHNDLLRIKELLHKLQNCLLINPKFKNFDLNVFYPCGCCSGQLIDI